MLNSVLLTGRLADDPTLRYTPAGVAVTNFVLAVQRNYIPEGQDQPDVDFIDCVAWKELAEHIANYWRKGKPMTVREGRLQKRNYEREDGTKVYITEVVVNGVDFALSDPTLEAADNGNQGGRTGGNQRNNQGTGQSNSRQSQSGNNGRSTANRNGSSNNGNSRTGGQSGRSPRR